MSLQAISLLVQQRLITDVQDFQHRVDLRVIPPVCPLDVSPADFSHARSLIDTAYAGASRWLDAIGLEPIAETSDAALHRH